jgi:signal transduction histidine kinase
MFLKRQPDLIPRARPWLLNPRSLSQRLLAVAIVWIVALLVGGGFVLDRVITRALTTAYDAELTRTLSSLIGAAELGPEQEVRFTRPLGDQRFFEPYSGLYWQVSLPASAPFRSRSLWDRTLSSDLSQPMPEETRSTQLMWGEERLRLVEQDVLLPGWAKPYRFSVAARIDDLDLQVKQFRTTLFWALFAFGFGLIVLVFLQITVGLLPLRRVRAGLENIRTGRVKRLDPLYPPEVLPLVREMNSLLDHQDAAAEQARTQAGNLAHALKTPMAVLLNAARTAQENTHTDALAQTVIAQTEAMQRHVDHHLTRARALGRRANIAARAPVLARAQALKRVLARIYQEKEVEIELALPEALTFRGEKQDLDEMLGNLMDNACKYGAGKVRVHGELKFAQRKNEDKADLEPVFLSLLVEDNGPGIPDELAEDIFKRGVRLDESAPGTGLGLAIVKDLAHIYGGLAEVEPHTTLGGLGIRLTLPAAQN